MNSGAAWNDRGLSPELYDAAREAARRAGMSVEEWLSATFGKTAVASANRPSGGTPSRRFEAETAAPQRGERLSDTVAKLNALIARRDALVPQIQAALNAGHGDAGLLAQANQLTADAVALGNSTPPMPLDVSGTVPATLSLTLGPPGFQPLQMLRLISSPRRSASLSVWTKRAVHSGEPNSGPPGVRFTSL